MEAVSAAASIAGLLSVAGHVLTGLVKLNAFIQDVKEAGVRAQRLTKEAEIFSETLVDFKSLLKTLYEKASTDNPSFWKPHHARLHSRLEECAQDLDAWTESQRPEDGNPSRRRMIIDGIKNKKCQEILLLEEKLARHRSQICVEMSAMNVISLDELGKISAVDESVKKLSDTILRLEAQNVDRWDIMQDSARERLHLEELIRSTSSSNQQQLISEHHETRSQLSKVSDSMSSMVDSLQQLLDLPKKSQPRFSEALNDVGWTCARAIGIDDYFIESQEYQQSGEMRCVFCGQSFEGTESLERSRHMVDFHEFATCDQGACYGRIASFKSHLRDDHSADWGVISANIPGMRGTFYRQQWEIEDERTQSLYGEPQHLERSTGLLILESQLRSLISGFVGVRNLSSSYDANTLNDLRQGLKLLSDTVFSAEASLETAAILYQAANLVEELSVSFDRTLRNRWLSIPNILRQQISLPQGNNHRPATYTHLVVPAPLNSWFLSFDSRRKASVKSYDSCLECQNGTRYSTLDQAFQHRALCHSHQHCSIESEQRCPNNSTDWAMLTAELKISSLMKKLKNGWTTRERIDGWMLDVLHKSEHLLIVLRCSAFLDISSTFSTITANANQGDTTNTRLWGCMWTQDLLGAFDLWVEAADDDRFATQSDGAVYSHRDDVVVFNVKPQWDDLWLT